MNKETAILAAGCFWGVEELIRNLPGVIETEVGYTGGQIMNPKYEQVKTGQTGHIEAIKIDFDSQVLSFSNLLRFFFTIHDPTQIDGQGNDIGTQYTSNIFVFNEEQEKIAQEIIKEVDGTGNWKKPIVTQIRPVVPFYSAEEYHQDYLQKNPNGYTCHFIRKF